MIYVIARASSLIDQLVSIRGQWSYTNRTVIHHGNSSRDLYKSSVASNNREDDVLPHPPARVTRDPLEREDLLVDGPTCKTSVRTHRTQHALTAWAGPARLSRTQSQAARLAVGRQVRRVHGELGDLEVHDVLEEVRRPRLRGRQVETAGGEVASRLPARGVVAEERGLEQGALAKVFAPTPGHVVRTTDFDAYEVRPGVV